jgi:hypothetical protein
MFFKEYITKNVCTKCDNCRKETTTIFSFRALVPDFTMYACCNCIIEIGKEIDQLKKIILLS